MEILCECERYALVFVYREELLAAAIGPEAEDFLAGCGYRHGLTLAEKIARLRSRLGKCGEFPHEIGIFLGYPVEDVRGFIANEGRNFKACARGRFTATANARRGFSKATEDARNIFARWWSAARA